MWDLPGPGLEPVSPALAGGFLTTAPPGKRKTQFLKQKFDMAVTDLWVSSLSFCIMHTCVMHTRVFTENLEPAVQSTVLP